MKKKEYIPHSTPLELRPRGMIIGASSGIGAALAKKLAREGYVLALLARRGDRLAALCAEINEELKETRVFAYPHNVTDFDAIPGLFQQIFKDLRGMDLVVYNAGVMHNVGDEEYTFAKDKEMVDVNLLGAMAWLGETAKVFEQIGAGQIVGVSSVAGDRGRAPNPGHNASKAGLTTYLEGLRNRLSSKGINVVTIKPGFVNTAMAQSVADSPLIITPEQAADEIFVAIRKRKQTKYVPLIWSLIMLVIVLIPSFIFRRMKI